MRRRCPVSRIRHSPPSGSTAVCEPGPQLVRPERQRVGGHLLAGEEPAGVLVGVVGGLDDRAAGVGEERRDGRHDADPVRAAEGDHVTAGMGPLRGCRFRRRESGFPRPPRCSAAATRPGRRRPPCRRPRRRRRTRLDAAVQPVGLWSLPGRRRDEPRLTGVGRVVEHGAGGVGGRRRPIMNMSASSTPSAANSGSNTRWSTVSPCAACSASSRWMAVSCACRRAHQPVVPVAPNVHAGASGPRRRQPVEHGVDLRRPRTRAGSPSPRAVARSSAPPRRDRPPGRARPSCAPVRCAARAGARSSPARSARRRPVRPSPRRRATRRPAPAPVRGKRRTPRRH